MEFHLILCFTTALLVFLARGLLPRKETQLCCFENERGATTAQSTK